MRPDGRDLGRRDVLRAGLAAGVAMAGGASARRAAGQGKGKVRFAYLQLGWAACEIIHKEDLLGKRGWQTEYNVVAGLPAPGSSTPSRAGNVDAIDMSFALSAKMFEDGVPAEGHRRGDGGAGRHRRPEATPGIGKVEDLKGRKIAAVVGTTTFLDIRTLTLKGVRHRRPEGHAAHHRSRRRRTWPPCSRRRTWTP